MRGCTHWQLAYVGFVGHTMLTGKFLLQADKPAHAKHDTPFMHGIIVLCSFWLHKPLKRLSQIGSVLPGIGAINSSLHGAQVTGNSPSPPIVVGEYRLRMVSQRSALFQASVAEVTTMQVLIGTSVLLEARIPDSTHNDSLSKSSRGKSLVFVIFRSFSF